MLQYLDPVPFTIENEAHFGLSETQGILSSDGGSLLIEYRMADTIVGAVKTQSKTVAIPFDEIRSIRMERKFLGMVNRIVIRTRSQVTLDFLPDAKGGMVTLKLNRRDAEPAEGLCLAVQEAVLRQRNLKLGDELDRLES
jgi:hypothetical protein